MNELKILITLYYKPNTNLGNTKEKSKPKTSNIGPRNHHRNINYYNPQRPTTQMTTNGRMDKYITE